jgi:3-hydroxyanthranilate 3,4-dioxygenase
MGILSEQKEPTGGAAAEPCTPTQATVPTHPAPFHFLSWIETNKHLFKPPVGNKMITSKGAQFKTMVVGGPNTRTDYHVNQGEEWFYMIKGHMVLKVVDGGRFRDIPIMEGETFMLAPGVPHSPQRYLDSYGLVIERERDPSELDGLRWYCPAPACRAVCRVVYEEYFVCQDLGVPIGSQLKVLIEKYYATESLRTCKHCGTIDVKPPLLSVTEALERAKANAAVVAKQECNKSLPYLDAKHPLAFSLDALVKPYITATTATATATTTATATATATVAAVSTPEKEKAPATKPVFETEFRVRIEAGADTRTSYRCSKDTEEWYWQWHGDLTIQTEGTNLVKSQTMVVHAGEIYLLPLGMSHRTRRSEDSVGVVVETSFMPPPSK